MRPTIKDVAKLAGVSTATVSYVINNNRFVSEESREKVNRAMQELQYFPSALARSLRVKRTRTVGLIVPQLSNQYFTKAAQGVEMILQQNGYNLMISESNSDWLVEKNLIMVFNSLLVDGLIIVPSARFQNDLQDVLRGSYPTVFLDRRPNQLAGDAVVLDNFASTYEATMFLIRAGHTRIGLLLGAEWYSTSRDRVRGYRQAHEQSFLAFDQNLIRHGDFGLESGLLFTQELLDAAQPTAVIASSCDMTLGAFLKAKERGLAIPGQFAIIGCDDLPWATATEPAISMIHQPSTELGKAAAELLLKRIESPSEKFETIYMPTRLHLRGST